MENRSKVNVADPTARWAFTLAEILITLGIIGVVAVITLPAVINDIRGKQLETALKKGATVIEQTIMKINLEEGENLTSLNIGFRQLKRKMIKHMNIIQDCGLGAEESSCVYRMNFIYKTYNNKNQTLFVSYFDDGQFVLSDGSFIMLENAGVSGINNVFIHIDVNGYKKLPNRAGHDLFTFQLMEDGRILPMGAEGTLYDEENYCSHTLNSNLNGLGCTSKALREKDYFINLPK